MRLFALLVLAAAVSGCTPGGSAPTPAAGGGSAANTSALAQMQIYPHVAAMGTRTTQGTAISFAGYTEIPGIASSVAMSSDGSVWAIATDNCCAGGSSIWHYSGGRWTQLPGAAVQITVGSDGTVWVASEGTAYHWEPATNTWDQPGGSAASGWYTCGCMKGLSAGSGGDLFALDTAAAGMILYYDGAAWHNINGPSLGSNFPSSVVQVAADELGQTPVVGYDCGAYDPFPTEGFYVLSADGSVYAFATYYPQNYSCITTWQVALWDPYGALSQIAPVTVPDLIDNYFPGQAGGVVGTGLGQGVDGNGAGNASLWADNLSGPYNSSSVDWSEIFASGVKTVSTAGGNSIVPGGMAAIIATDGSIWVGATGLGWWGSSATGARSHE